MKNEKVNVYENKENEVKIDLQHKNIDGVIDSNENLKGLSGWLILVGLGVVLSPIRLIFVVNQVYGSIFFDGTWALISSKDSEFYNPYLASLIIIEIIYNILMIIACIYLIYLFFTKHYRFPSIYIIITIITIVFIPLDAYMVYLLVPDQPIFDEETAKEFGRVIFFAMIWVPYLLKSKRVKVTFVEKKPIYNHN